MAFDRQAHNRRSASARSNRDRERGPLERTRRDAISKPPIDPKATIKDAALKALDDSFDYGIALLKGQSDQTLLQPAGAPPPFLGPSSRARIIGFLVGHTWDTYGQLA